MKIVNSWNYLYLKDWLVVDVELRISLVTLFALYIDLSPARLRLTILNFRLEVGGP